MANKAPDPMMSAVAHIRWAKVTDRTAATQAMRDGFLEKLRRDARELLGPEASDAAVTRSADSLLKAHYARMRAARQKAAARKAQC